VNGYYKQDLAFIHDVGFGEWALKSAPGILEILKQTGIREGLVVDLGCGSGLWARELAKANYEVLGIDISEAMIAIARKRVPIADFRVASLFTAKIPACNAVTSISECLNYTFVSKTENLARLFRRIYKALTPGGVFVFDLAGPGQVKRGTTTKRFTEGDGWLVLVEKHEDEAKEVLTRRITSFRSAGAHYRRSDEVHLQRLFRFADVAKELRSAGFRVRTGRSYGQYRLPALTRCLLPANRSRWCKQSLDCCCSGQPLGRAQRWKPNAFDFLAPRYSNRIGSSGRLAGWSLEALGSGDCLFDTTRH
jgi:SAM-dependent methyltransferase